MERKAEKRRSSKLKRVTIKTCKRTGTRKKFEGWNTVRGVLGKKIYEKKGQKWVKQTGIILPRNKKRTLGEGQKQKLHINWDGGEDPTLAN